ncbi:hypothetical protein ACKWTF_013415 [Chironomus riparius]
MDYPRFYTIIQFPALKLQDLFFIFQDIEEQDGDLSKIIILTSTDEVAKTLTYELNKRHISVSLVTGSRKERKNRRAADGYSEGKFDVLIVSSSRISVETGEVAHFINYDIEDLGLFINKAKLRQRG